MITIYRMFQIIMGIILSAFIFYLLIDFAGSYNLLGKDGIRQKTLDVFLQDVDSVYFSGNPATFTAFSDDDYSSCHPRPTNPPRIFCFIDRRSYETERLAVPILMRVDGDALITRNTIDMGWTRFDYIEALSDMTVVFNPRDMSDETWDTIRQVAEAFPDTTQYGTKVLFEFCDGRSLLIKENVGKSYEKQDFLDIITTSRDAYAECTANLGRNHVLVTISDSCSQSFSPSGICVVPSSSGVGKAYITGIDDEFVYKDAADLAALIIGGAGKNIFENAMGEEEWRFKNNLMLRKIRTASRVMERRCELINQLSSGNISDECREMYAHLRESMSRLYSLSAGNYSNIGDMEALVQELGNSKDIWNSLLATGCERYGT